jgi:hypothetical protein
MARQAHETFTTQRDIEALIIKKNTIASTIQKSQNYPLKLTQVAARFSTFGYSPHWAKLLKARLAYSDQ